MIHPMEMAEWHDRVRAYVAARRIDEAIATRWFAWASCDGLALLDLAEGLGLGGNQIDDFMTWLEDIAARDAVAPAAVLAAREIRGVLATRLGRSDKVKRVKALVRARRFPRLAALERALAEEVRALGLGPGVAVRFPPDFEGDEITVELRARHVEALRAAVDRVDAALRAGGFERLFRRFDGDAG
jgi:hypothetical protein